MVDAITNHLLFSNIVEFLHGYITKPIVSPADRILHALKFQSCAIKDFPASVHHEQILAISSLRDLLSNWIPSTTLFPPTPDPVQYLPLTVPVLPVQDHPQLPPPRVVPIPRVEPPPRMDHAAPIEPIPTLFPSPNLVTPTPSQPLAHQTRSRLALTAHTASLLKYPSDIIRNWAFSVIDETTVQTLENRQLRRHPAYK